MERARQMVQAITVEPEVGATYEGPVKSTTAFGAFVEIMPGTEGLVHISELQHGRTEKTEDVVKRGDRVKVKVIERDERGRLRLSMKALIPKPGADAAAGEPAYADATAGAPASAAGEERPRREGGDGGGRGRGGRSGGRGGRGR
jgi:polyribonucleotide nucleotidyltransferase